MNESLKSSLKYAACGMATFLGLAGLCDLGESLVKPALACDNTYKAEDGALVYDVPVRKVNGKMDKLTVDVGEVHLLFCNEMQTDATTILMTCVGADKNNDARILTFAHGPDA